MIHQNTLRTPLSAEVRAGIHLVYSRHWPVESRTPAKPRLVAARRADRETVNILSLAAAALTAPFVWIGHAILRAMHVL